MVEAGLARRRIVALRYVAMLVITFLLGVGAVELAARGQSTSAWWPAAGASAVTLLLVPHRWRASAASGLVLFTGLSNLVAGRPWDLSLAFGFVNAIEALAVVWFVTRDGANPRLGSVHEVSRLLGAAVMGAAIAALTASAAVTLFASGEFLGTSLSVFTSHVSALLTIVPLALAWRPDARSHGSTYRWVQPVAMGAIVAAVFTPSNELPVSFTIFPVLMWGAFVLSMRALSVELVLMATAVTTLTMFGGGPFALDEWGELERRFVVQGFLLTFAISALYVSAARIEQLVSSDAVRRREELLRSGVVGAPVGMLMLQEQEDGSLLVLQTNDRAHVSLGKVLDGAERPDSGVVLAADSDDEGARAVLDAVRETARAAGRQHPPIEFPVDGRMLELTAARIVDAERTLTTVHIDDVTVRRRTDSALRKALRDERESAIALRAADQQREEFVAAVSHELRTPITSILGFVEVLLDESDPDPDVRGQLEIIERNAIRLGALVEDILALTAQSKARNTACNVSALASEAVTDLRRTAEEHDVQLRLTDSPAVFVMGIRADLERILINLLNNAVKFTPAGGSVSVHVETLAELVVLTVADTGPGIPPEQLTTMFDRFERGSFAKDNQIAGVGLGLSMVKELSERNGFAVRLESDGDSGTTAILEMPRTSAPEFTT